MSAKSKKMSVKKLIEREVTPKQMSVIKGGKNASIVEETAEGF